jgi:tetratricopeptide (TPR) repeat protein
MNSSFSTFTKFAVAAFIFIGTAAPSVAATQSNCNQHASLAQAAEAQGDMAAALREYNEALRCEPNALNVRFQRAFVRYSLGDTKGALKDINIVRKTNPAALNSYGNIAMMEAEVGDHKAALMDYTLELAVSSSDPDSQQRSFWLWQRAITKLQLHDKQGAIRDLDDALLVNDAEQFVPAISEFRHEVLTKANEHKVQSAQSVRSNPAA